MARKIRLTGLGIIFVVIIAGLIAICVASGSKIGDVKSVAVADNGSDFVSLKWSKIGSADGYIIYQKDGENFKKIKTTNDSSVNKYIVKNLEEAKKYTFAVKGYKEFGKKVVISENFTQIKTITIPTKQIVELSAPIAEQIQIDLVQSKNCSGYEIEYGLKKDFSDAQSVQIKNSKETSKAIEKLEVDKTYYFRARSYVNDEKNVVYGAWSDTKSKKVLSVAEMSKIDKSKPMIAVTFDDGPGYNSASDRIVDVIEKYHIKATFFMVGNNAADHPKNVQRKAKLGCEIGNHTIAHAHYGKNVTPSDISKATEAISKAGGGVKVTAFRSTGGQTTDTIRTECKKEGMPLYYWSLDTEDWKSRNADAVYKKVMNNVQDGDIILMHEIYGSTADAFEKMVPELLKKGYQFVTCEELIAAKTGKKPVAGTQYVNATTIKNNTY